MELKQILDGAALLDESLGPAEIDIRETSQPAESANKNDGVDNATPKQEAAAPQNQQQHMQIAPIKTALEFNTLTVKETPKPEEFDNQSLHEEDLVDQNGEFIIFSNEESPELSNPQSISNSFVTDMSYQFDINSVGAGTPHLKNFDDAADLVLFSKLEPNFKKLNRNHKITILLKALIMERNKNSE